MNACKPISKFNTILCKIYLYFDKLYNLSSLSDISDPVGDKKYYTRDDTTPSLIIRSYFWSKIGRKKTLLFNFETKFLNKTIKINLPNLFLILDN